MKAGSYPPNLEHNRAKTPAEEYANPIGQSSMGGEADGDKNHVNVDKTAHTHSALYGDRCLRALQSSLRRRLTT